VAVVAIIAWLAGVAWPHASAGTMPRSKAAMSEAEAAAFHSFVRFWQEQDICWKATVTRGVGRVPTECPNADKDAGLCYPKCPPGFYGLGPLCWQSCPPGFRDDGTFCRKPSGYRRGAGYPWTFGDAISDSGMFSRCERDYGRGNCEKVGLIVYPKCRQGFHAVGCCICTPACPAGMTDIGVSCTKQSRGRGVGHVPSCRPDQDADAGLCYAKCPAGTTGIGPVCWAGCTSEFPEDCGAACGKSAGACAVAILNQVSATGELALNVASFIAGAGPSAKIAMTAARNAARQAGKSVLSIEARHAAIVAIKRRLREEAENEGRNMSEKALDMASTALEIAKENGEFDWESLDPTGILEVINAFNKPICGR